MLSGDDNYILMKKCNPLYFEFIFRNLLTGSALQRALNGTLKLPEGMVCEEYSRFPQPFIEISTKREVKDRYNLNMDDIQKIMRDSLPELNLKSAMMLYNEALKKVKIISRLMTSLFDKAELILVDGKIELGVTEEKELCVIDSFGPDEFRTFDKSWLKSNRSTPPSFYDKEFIRTKLKNIKRNNYGKILNENGEDLITRYKEVVTRLYMASK